MDLHGSMLNYEGISVLNDVESATMAGDKKRIFGWLIPTPSCLQNVAKVLEMHGHAICPFERFETKYGESIEFNYAKTAHLVIEAFGLSAVGKTQSINISASIDAAKITKNLTHTSAGIKRTDIAGKTP